ncbi:alpha/beta fold hydrolase [Magnetospira thiophila]
MAPRLLALLMTLSLAFPALAEEVTIKPQDLTLNADLVLAEGKTLKDGVLLMVHGTMAHKDMEIIGGMQTLLAARGVNSLALNLSLGLDDRHGMYDCKVPHHHAHEDAVDEIGDWVGWLKQQGAGPIALFGHSRGGNQVAWFAATEAGKDITKVVMVAPMTYGIVAEAKSYRKQYGKELLANMDQAMRIQDGGRDDMLTAVPFLHCAEADVAASSFLAYYHGDMRKDTPALLKKIKQPKLIIVSNDDPVVPELIEAVNQVADPGTRMEVMEGAGHFFPDLYAEDLADLVAEFLK